MSDYYDRLLVEQKELTDRVRKLEKFITESPIYSSVSLMQRKWLDLQFKHMSDYLSVLNLRLNDLEKDRPSES